MADWDDDEYGKKRGRREPDFDAGDRARRRELAVDPDDRPGPSDLNRRPRNKRRDPDFAPPIATDDWDETPRRRARRDDDFAPEPPMSRRRDMRDEDYDDPPPPPRRERRPRERGERRPAPPRRSLPRRIVYWGAVASVWGVIACAGLIGYHAMKLPPIDQLAVPKRPPNIAILAADGTLMANRGETGGSNVPIGELPKYVPKAFVAIEDKRFYDHFGLDVVGLGRAVIRNITSRKVEQGGSTLTQQLAKNLFLTQERTMSRKVQEAILAFWLERNYRKDQILELYLNRVYFGSGAYGIEAAAQKYFAKSARSLTVAESAILAGLMKSPSRLAPNRNPDGAAERAAIVLKEMLDQGYVTQQQAKVALAAPAEARRNTGAGSVNYAADWVMDLLDDYVGSIDGDVQVTTTFLMPMQNAAERALTSALDASGDAKNVDQGAIVAMAPDGAVRALVGGRNYGESQFNRAVLAKRQPGSSFKPFVYLAALENGLTPETVREDSPINIKGWQPENYTREYFGNVSLTKALSMSLNTVAVKLGQEVGVKNVMRTAQRLGVNSPLAANASLPLGTSEVTPLEMTAAYSALANGGTGVAPYVISRVKTTAGKLIYERKDFNRGRVIEPQHLAQMNLMMRETLVNGTAKKAELPGWVAAGKTGTTQDHKDAWFIGYTSALTATVWLGNDDGDPMKKVTGSGLPVEIWSRFMRAALIGMPVQPLPGLAHVAGPPREAPPRELLQWREVDLNARSSEDMRPPLPLTSRAAPVPAPSPRPTMQAVAVREPQPRREEPAAAQPRLVPPRPIGPTATPTPRPDRDFFAGPSETDRERLNRLLSVR